jgi:3-dehydroquinate dehydratase/shikimate dehydrogenase
MNSPSIERLIDASNVPVIVTNRPACEGGKFNGTEKERITYLQRACHLGVKYVDMELDHFHDLDRKATTRLIVSYHNFNETPQNLDEIYSKIVDKGADIVKIATKANSYDDSRRMLNLIAAKHNEMDIIGICMGEKGVATRVLGPVYGGYLTFASLEGKASAPGQLDVHDLKTAWNVLRMDKE